MKRLVISVLIFVVLAAGGIFFLTNKDGQVSVATKNNSRNNVAEMSPQKQLQMEKAPTRYQQLASKSDRGKVERMTYQTTYKNQTYPKRALVYLPAGYSENTSKQYNIVYLMHGWSMSEDDFLGNTGTDQSAPFKRMLDHEIAEKRIEPVIVVTPTYYPNRSVVTDNWSDDDQLDLSFATTELPQDLIPAVEKRYRTYAQSTDLKGLTASRNHRAFAGFSMGAITTWYVFEHQLNLFKYFMPMAGDSWTVEANGGATAPAKTADKLVDQIKRTNYQPNDYMILASVGGADGTGSQMSPLITRLREHAQQFTDKNLLYSTDPNGGHDEKSVINQAYNSLPVLFSNN